MNASATARVPRWRELRDRLLASPAFQRLALRFPLSRPIARRHAAELFDLVAGFVYTQVLHACVKLRLLEAMQQGPRSVRDLAIHSGLEPAAAERLLAAAAALRLAERRGDETYGLGRLGAALLANPGIAAMVEHHAVLYGDLADPVALLRGETGRPALQRYWSYAGEHPGEAPAKEAAAFAEYSALMSASQALVAEEVLAAYPFARHRCLLDVGGGDGTFLASVAATAPDLRVVLFDLPPVAELARARFARAGLSHRARAVGGDFRADALPRGADAISLVRVLHDHDDPTVEALLRAVRRALEPGGRLVIAEPLAAAAGAERMGDAYFGLYLLAMGQGRPRSAATYRSMLEAAGFTAVQEIRTRLPLATGLVVARA